MRGAPDPEPRVDAWAGWAMGLAAVICLIVAVWLIFTGANR